MIDVNDYFFALHTCTNVSWYSYIKIKVQIKHEHIFIEKD